MTIEHWLRDATRELQAAAVPSAQLDAELLLAETLRRPRTFLHAHPAEEIDPRRRDIADARLSLRLDRVPMAYILGRKEFYGREFTVSPRVLIPRPESEMMITLLLELAPKDNRPKTLLDVGTGSGCLGITAALELPPNWHVILSDVSSPALDVAKSNAKRLGAKVFCQKQSLLTGQIEKVDCILANLPYVDAAWETSPELRHEPAEALYADEGGLRLIRQLIQQAPLHMTKQGLLLLEADEEQHQTIIGFGRNQGFDYVTTRDMIVALRFIGAES